jgi:hypothetical protein
MRRAACKRQAQELPYRAVVESHSMLQAFARFGLAAKGVVYMLIAGLALGAALGGGRAGDSQEAMGSLRGAPLGELMLGVIGVGLAGYALWRLYSAIANPDDEKPGKRLLYVGTGLVNLFLAVEAIRMGWLSGRASSGNEAPHWTAELMSRPYGVWLVAAAGALIGGYGIAQLVRALQARLDKHLRLGELSDSAHTWVRRLARAGLAARGVVFVVAAIFLIRAALQHDPSEARDWGASMQAIQQQPFGKWLLAATALGLFLYGCYNVVRARYRVIRT